jgi:hypothetical protein
MNVAEKQQACIASMALIEALRTAAPHSLGCQHCSVCVRRFSAYHASDCTAACCVCTLLLLLFIDSSSVQCMNLISNGDMVTACATPLCMYMICLNNTASFFYASAVQRMNLIIKGDTSGVVEAIKGALQGLPQVTRGLETALVLRFSDMCRVEGC